MISWSQLIATTSWRIKAGLDFLEFLIQFIEVDICENRRTNTTLRGTAVGFVVFPVLYISRLEKLSDNVKKFAILNLSAKDGNQYLMVDVIETSLDITFNKPCDARKIR